MIRSLLYVPASSERFVAKAHERGADAIILDLEDAVAPSEKASARANLAAAVPKVGQSGATATPPESVKTQAHVGQEKRLIGVSGARGVFARGSRSDCRALSACSLVSRPLSTSWRIQSGNCDMESVIRFLSFQGATAVP